MDHSFIFPKISKQLFVLDLKTKQKKQTNKKKKPITATRDVQPVSTLCLF